MKGCRSAAYLILVVCFGGLWSFADSITLEQMNYLTLLSVTNSDVSVLIASNASYPDPPMTAVGKGTFTTTGWTYDLSTVYLGNVLSLHYVGSFDSITDSGSWTGTGNYGPKNLNSDGTIQFLGDNATILGVFQDEKANWKGDLTFAFNFDTGKIGLNLNFSTDFMGSGNGHGTFVSSLSVIGDGGLQAKLDYTQTLDQINTSLDAVLKGFGKDNGLTLGVNFAPIPEPSSFFLLGSGILGLGGLLRRHLPMQRSNLPEQ